MAFQNSLSGRMEELRFPSLRSPEHDSFPSNGPPSSRGDGSFFPSGNNDNRSSLQRRFTTDASKMSLSRPFGAQGQFNNNIPQPVRTRSSHPCVESLKDVIELETLL